MTYQQTKPQYRIMKTETEDRTGSVVDSCDVAASRKENEISPLNLWKQSKDRGDVRRSWVVQQC